MIHLLSFADKRMSKSLDRLAYQAEQMRFFDQLHMFDEDDLSCDFRTLYKEKLVSGLRGYGYWVWKPQVISQVLDRIGDNDLLLYLDAGCHLNKLGLGRLKHYFHILDSSPQGILAFQSKPPTRDLSPLKYDGRKLFDQWNYEWIKGDLFDHLGVRHDSFYTHARVIGAGIILIKNCKSAKAIISEWLSVIRHDFSLLDDTPSKSPNLKGFQEHRHDQAIFSLLCLKYNVPTLSSYEYWYPKSSSSYRLNPDWSALKDFPIHARRDKDFGMLYSIKVFLWRLPKRMLSLPRRIFFFIRSKMS